MKSHMVKMIVLSLCVIAISSCNAQPPNLETQKMSDEATIVLINPFIVPENRLEETVAMWEQARDFLQTQPGYVSTELHQSTTPDAKFRLINVAKWDSVESFKAATSKMNAEAGLPRIEGVVPNPALYTVVKRD